MRAFSSAVCFAVVLLVATVARTATIEPVQGDLSINHGQGFEKVNGRIDANVGDAVMVSPDGSAVVSYPDGCTVNVQPGAVMTIAPLSPCASGSYAQDQSQTNTAAGVALGVGAAALMGFGIYEATTQPGPRPASP
jgi:hypothetical protein